MGIVEPIRNAIRRAYDQGGTQGKIAKRFSLSQGYVGRLLSGKRDFEGITIGTVEKMFPRSTINLYGEPAAPALPADPFLRMVVENWPRLAPEDRGRVAGLVSGLVEGKNHAAASIGGAGTKIG